MILKEKQKPRPSTSLTDRVIRNSCFPAKLPLAGSTNGALTDRIWSRAHSFHSSPWLAAARPCFSSEQHMVSSSGGGRRRHHEQKISRQWFADSLREYDAAESVLCPPSLETQAGLRLPSQRQKEVALHERTPHWAASCMSQTGLARDPQASPAWEGIHSTLASLPGERPGGSGKLVVDLFFLSNPCARPIKADGFQRWAADVACPGHDPGTRCGEGP